MHVVTFVSKPYIYMIYLYFIPFSLQTGKTSECQFVDKLEAFVHDLQERNIRRAFTGRKPLQKKAIHILARWIKAQHLLFGERVIILGYILYLSLNIFILIDVYNCDSFICIHLVNITYFTYFGSKYVDNKISLRVAY